MQNCKSTIFQYLKKEMQRRSSIKRTLKDIIVCFLSREKKKKKKKPTGGKYSILYLDSSASSPRHCLG